MKFPDINYNLRLSNWNKSIGEGKVYTNNNIAKYISFGKDINACQDF